MALRNFAEATRRGYAIDLRHFPAYLTATFGIESVGGVAAGVPDSTQESDHADQDL